MARLEIHLLGPLQVLLDGSPVSFESSKVRALLAVLAGEAPRPQFRESLAGLIWPDWPQQSAMSNLRYALADLRKNTGDRDAHPPYFLINRESIQLDLESDVSVDAAELLKAGDPDRYRGLFLEGFSLPDSPEFTEWLEAKRSYYQQQALEMLGKKAADCEQSGEHKQGLAYARRQLAIEPWLEEAHRQVMRLLALSGQRNAALAQYEACKRVLEKELKTAPDEETRALYERMRTGTGTTASGLPASFPLLATSPEPLHNLPVQITSFIGREKEIAEIRGLFTDRAARLVTLTGSGGCGKTRLALEVAASLLESFPDGVWLAELAPLADPDRVPMAVASALGLKISGNLPVLEALTAYLKRRKLLLVLDNCEHVLDACARLVEHLLRACPGLVILASSREGLGVPGETAYRVPSLGLPDPHQAEDVEIMAQSEAVRLFVSRAMLSRPGFQVTAQNAPAIAQICRRLDGIPLAIELAAGRVSALSVEQIAARLADSFRLLTGGSRTALPRQQTLRASIDWSYSLLSEPEHLLLKRLSAFSGGWTIEAAEKVCGGDGLEPADVFDLLDSLVRKSLVVFGGEPPARDQEPRYHLLETIRQYAREKLFVDGGGEALRRQHLAYFMEMAGQAEAELFSLRETYWLTRLDLELENIRAALDWGVCDESALSFQNGLRLIASLHFGTSNIDANERSGWLEKYRPRPDRMEEVPLELLVKMWSACCEIHFTQGLPVEARQDAVTCLNLSQQLGDSQRLIEAFFGLAYCDSWLGDSEAQLEHLNQALALAEQAGGTAQVWYELYFNKANYFETHADPVQAKACYRKCIEIAEKAGSRMGLVNCFRHLGAIVAWEGDDLLANEYIKSAVDIDREINSLASLRWDLFVSGDIAYHQGRFDQMEVDYREAALLSEKTGFQVGQVWADHNIGVAARRKGELERAIQLTLQSLAAAHKPGWEAMVNECIGSLAGIAADLGRCRQSALLLGACSNHMHSPNAGPVSVGEFQRDLPVVRAALGDAAFEVAFAEGKALTLEAAVELGREAVEERRGEGETR
jgi:predicted ATPase/DNA-binding SARP family transcriptional activator